MSFGTMIQNMIDAAEAWDEGIASFWIGILTTIAEAFGFEVTNPFDA